MMIAVVFSHVAAEFGYMFFDDWRLERWFRHREARTNRMTDAEVSNTEDANSPSREAGA